MRLEVLFVRYFDVGQNPVMINKDGIVYRLDANNLLVEEALNFQLSEEAIELTEVSFFKAI
jgi:hypothetical protein